MNQSEKINELALALCSAQKEMQPAKKDADNPFFKSKYATLQSVWDSCRLPLTKNNLSVSQAAITEGGLLTLVTTLMHASGQWQKSYYPVYSKDNSPQAIASAWTYARRYSLSALVGVVTDEDDDGNAASHSEGPKVEYQKVAHLPAATGVKKQGCISDKQAARLLMIALKNGYSEKQVIEHVLRNYQVNQLIDLPWKVYETVVNQFSQPVILKDENPPLPKDEDFF